MKQILLLVMAVVLVGCGKEETTKYKSPVAMSEVEKKTIAERMYNNYKNEIHREYEDTESIDVVMGKIRKEVHRIVDSKGAQYRDGGDIINWVMEMWVNSDKE